jgi:hypothetical protein
MGLCTGWFHLLTNNVPAMLCLRKETSNASQALKKHPCFSLFYFRYFLEKEKHDNVPL